MSPRPHKTKKITIKTAEVDERIVPLIKAMNNLPGVTTLFSCEGDKNMKKAMTSLPYVSFTCDNPLSLARMAQVFPYESIRVTGLPFGSLKYVVRLEINEMKKILKEESWKRF